MANPVTFAQYFELTRWVISIIVPAVAGLVGILVGAYLTGRREIVQRRLRFIEKQLDEFYSPLLGIRKEIVTRSNLRVRVHEAARITWEELCESARAIGEDALVNLTKNRGPHFEKLIEHDNKIFSEELVPSYKRMAILFREKLWLAEPETTEHYQKLIDFVEIWERWLNKSISPEMLEKLNVEEEALFPLYKELQRTHDSLRAKIKNGKP